MFKQAFRQMKTAVLLLGIFTVLTGLIYPMLVTAIAQLFFSWQANGSLIEYQGKIVGSTFIGQEVKDPRYFWGRPSATTPFPYNALKSAGSNLGPANPELIKIVNLRKDAIRRANPDIDIPMPIELVTASASGLDPDLGIRGALYQVPRIAKARKLHKEKIVGLITELSIVTSCRIFGEDRVNVLQLNLALDQLR